MPFSSDLEGPDNEMPENVDRGGDALGQSGGWRSWHSGHALACLPAKGLWATAPPAYAEVAPAVHTIVPGPGQTRWPARSLRTCYDRKAVVPILFVVKFRPPLSYQGKRRVVGSRLPRPPRGHPSLATWR